MKKQTTHVIEKLVKSYCASWKDIDKQLFKLELERLVIVAKMEAHKELKTGKVDN